MGRPTMYARSKRGERGTEMEVGWQKDEGECYWIRRANIAVQRDEEGERERKREIHSGREKGKA